MSRRSPPPGWWSRWRTRACGSCWCVRAAWFVHSRHGTSHARPGMLVIVCARTLCGAIPEPSATVTTAFVNLDYLLHQLMWRLNGLLRDRHEAELIATKAFRHNKWATTPPAQATADTLDLLDRTEAIQDAGGGFYDIEAVFATFLADLVPLMPYRELPGEPVVSLAGDGVGGRFPPLRPKSSSSGTSSKRTCRAGGRWRTWRRSPTFPGGTWPACSTSLTGCRRCSSSQLFAPRRWRACCGRSQDGRWKRGPPGRLGRTLACPPPVCPRTRALAR